MSGYFVAAALISVTISGKLWYKLMVGGKFGSAAATAGGAVSGAATAAASARLMARRGREGRRRVGRIRGGCQNAPLPGRPQWDQPPLGPGSFIVVFYVAPPPP